MSEGASQKPSKASEILLDLHTFKAVIIFATKEEMLEIFWAGNIDSIS